MANNTLEYVITVKDDSGTVLNKFMGKAAAAGKALGAATKSGAGFANVARSTSGSVKNLAGGLIDMGRSAFSATGLMEGLGFALSVGGFLKATNAAFDFGNALLRMSQQTNVSVENLQLLRLAARESRIDFNEVAGAFDTFRKNAEAAASGANIEFSFFVDSIQPGLSKVLAATADPIEGFTLLAKAVNGMTDNYRRHRAELVLFGKEGGDIDALLRNWAEHSDTYREKLKGATITDADAKRLEEGKFAWQHLGDRMAATRNLIAVAVEPAMERMYNALDKLILGTEGVGESTGRFAGFIKVMSRSLDQATYVLDYISNKVIPRMSSAFDLILGPLNIYTHAMGFAVEKADLFMAAFFLFPSISKAVAIGLFDLGASFFRAAPAIEGVAASSITLLGVWGKMLGMVPKLMAVSTVFNAGMSASQDATKVTDSAAFKDATTDEERSRVKREGLEKIWKERGAGINSALESNPWTSWTALPGKAHDWLADKFSSGATDPNAMPVPQLFAPLPSGADSGRGQSDIRLKLDFGNVPPNTEITTTQSGPRVPMSTTTTYARNQPNGNF